MCRTILPLTLLALLASSAFAFIVVRQVDATTTPLDVFTSTTAVVEDASTTTAVELATNTTATPDDAAADATPDPTSEADKSAVTTDESFAGDNTFTPSSRDPSTAGPVGDKKDGSKCFPAHATVTLRSGASSRMDELAVGDAVHIGNGDFSEVFMFTHKLSGALSAFRRLTSASGAGVELTDGHYIYAGGALVRARDVAVGDELAVDGGAALSRVVRVEVVEARGLFNPQTLHGDIVVDGVVASTYTTALEPGLAHALLAPLRAVYTALGLRCDALEYGAGAFVGAAPGTAVVA
jgi:desert hedgehog